MTAETIATPGCPSQLTSPRPIPTRYELMSPNPGWYSQFQISTTTETGSTYGAKNASRNSHCMRRTRLTSSARPNASRTSGGTLSSVNSAVCHIAAQKFGSSSSSR